MALAVFCLWCSNLVDYFGTTECVHDGDITYVSAARDIAALENMSWIAVQATGSARKQYPFQRGGGEGQACM